MNTAYIGLGSNMGESLQVLLDAWQELGRRPEIRLVCLSSPYRTEPVGMQSRQWFCNAAGSLRTSLNPEELLDHLMEIEQRLGRTRGGSGKRYQDRIIDLDLLLYDQLIISSPRLVLPHPEMAGRAFVLMPLQEIAGQVLHPVCNRTVDELLLALSGSGKEPVVEKISWPSFPPSRATDGIHP